MRARPYGVAPISCYYAPMPAPARKPSKPRSSGNLRIGDQWNAITIIALSQSNPLKAVAELVENSIDARAKNIVITRGKERGQHYLRVKDDGEGVRRNLCGVSRDVFDHRGAYLSKEFAEPDAVM